MLSFCRQTDRQTDNGNTICINLLMQGHKHKIFLSVKGLILSLIADWIAFCFFLCLNFKGNLTGPFCNSKDSGQTAQEHGTGSSHIHIRHAL